MDPHGTGYASLTADDFLYDVTVLSTKSYVADENLKRVDIADGLYNHHNVFLDMTRKPPTLLGCSGKPASTSQMGVTVLMGGATEDTANIYTSLDGKYNSGYYIGKNQRMVNWVDVVNYSNQERTVYTISELEYVPGKVKNVKTTHNVVIPVDLCNQKSVADNPKIPEGKTKFALTGGDIDVLKDGHLVQACKLFRFYCFSFSIASKYPTYDFLKMKTLTPRLRWASSREVHRERLSDEE